eukprot:359563-Chlamydomonas_euryale.AAC.2
MKMLCYEFQDLEPSVLSLLRSSADELAPLLCARMDEIFADAGAAVVAGRPHNNRACKYVLNLMANVFNVPSLACSVGVGKCGRIQSDGRWVGGSVDGYRAMGGGCGEVWSDTERWEVGGGGGASSGGQRVDHAVAGVFGGCGEVWTDTERWEVGGEGALHLVANVLIMPLLAC